jgi:hypothetical protein
VTSRTSRTYRVQDESAPVSDDPFKGPMIVLTWDDLAAANEPETMAEIALLAVGERTILGQCDPIERLT